MQPAFDAPIVVQATVVQASPLPMAHAVTIQQPTTNPELVAMMSAGGTFKTTSPVQIGCASLNFESQRGQGSLTASTHITVKLCGCCPVLSANATTQFAPDYSSFTIIDGDGFPKQGVLASFDADKRSALYNYSGMGRNGHSAGTVSYDFRANTLTFNATAPKPMTVCMERT